MTYYCHDFDVREIFNPFRALRRVFEGGSAYWKAWAIALAALSSHFSGYSQPGLGSSLQASGFGKLLDSVSPRFSVSGSIWRLLRKHEKNNLRNCQNNMEKKKCPAHASCKAGLVFN